MTNNQQNGDSNDINQNKETIQLRSGPVPDHGMPYTPDSNDNREDEKPI